MQKSMSLKYEPSARRMLSTHELQLNALLLDNLLITYWSEST